MRVFVIGATGAISSRRVPRLIALNHEVIRTVSVAFTRSSSAITRPHCGGRLLSAAMPQDTVR